MARQRQTAQQGRADAVSACDMQAYSATTCKWLDQAAVKLQQLLHLPWNSLIISCSTRGTVQLPPNSLLVDAIWAISSTCSGQQHSGSVNAAANKTNTHPSQHPYLLTAAAQHRPCFIMLLSQLAVLSNCLCLCYGMLCALSLSQLSTPLLPAPHLCV
jgi:hypothetical protein